MNTTEAAGAGYGGMSRTQKGRQQWWRQLVGQQGQSGLSIRAFCQRHRTSEHRFYQRRRKRLAAQLPVKFALVETSHNANGQLRGRRTYAGHGRAIADRAGRRCSDAVGGAERGARIAMIHPPASVRVYFATSPCDMKNAPSGECRGT